MNLQLYINAAKHSFFKWVLRKRFLTAKAVKYNLKFRFFIRDGAGRDIYYKYGVYVEDYITSYLLESIGIQEDDLIVDIGANLGWYSLVLSWKARPLVYAFEPDPLNFSLLKHNIELNGRINIKPVNAGLDEMENVKTLYLYKKYNLGRHSFIRHPKSEQEVQVRTVNPG